MQKLLHTALRSEALAAHMEIVKNDEGQLAVCSDSCRTGFRTSEQWVELLTAALTTKVTVDGGMNDGIMHRYEVQCTVDDPEGSIVISGNTFLQLAGDSLRAALLSTIPTSSNPTTLKDFGYEVDEAGSMRALSDGLPKDGFIFWNETHFRFFRQAKLRHVRAQMEAEFGMVGRTVEEDPINGTVLCTGDIDTNDKMLVLVPGLGFGRPEQIGKMLSSLAPGESGTMIPHVRRARDAGYSVVILDPNAGMEEPLPEEDDRFAQQEWWVNLHRDEIIFSERDMDYHMNEHYIKGKSWAHSRAVWDALVKPSAATQIAVMGHSAGGSCLISVLQDDENARERVKAMVFSDCYELEGDPPTDKSMNYDLMKPYMKEVAKGWYIGADAPLGTPIEWIPNMYTCSDALDFDCVSSGCNVHNLIPLHALDSIFEYIESKLE